MTAKVGVAALFLALNAYVYHFLASEAVVPERRSFAEFPLELGPWQCPEPGEMQDKVVANLGVTDYLICTFRRDDPSGLVNVYVGYHETQIRTEGGGGDENSIHPPKHCLPGSGWSITEASQRPLDLEGLPERPHPVNRLIIAKGNERQLVYYWYQSRGRVIADDWRKVVDLMWDRARLGRTDGSLVRFTVPVTKEGMEVAEERFRELAARLLPRLAAYVPE